MKVYIITEKETGRFVSCHETIEDADRYNSILKAEVADKYQINIESTI